jgi:hypothetical protein
MRETRGIPASMSPGRRRQLISSAVVNGLRHLYPVHVAETVRLDPLPLMSEIAVLAIRFSMTGDKALAEAAARVSDAPPIGERHGARGIVSRADLILPAPIRHCVTDPGRPAIAAPQVVNINLESAVDHLANGRDRDLRYAALHLNAAIETLLKARLAREHWTLVVENVNQASRIKYETGNIHSVSITTAMTRLRNVVDSQISEEEIKCISKVEKLRNSVAHFALYEENPRRTEATVARGLDVLLHLIDREFLPTADSAERALVERTLAFVRVQLGKIQVLIRERMNTLRPALADAPYPVLICPECGQPAYVLGGGQPGRCLYCLDHSIAEIVALTSRTTDGPRLCKICRMDALAD